MQNSKAEKSNYSEAQILKKLEKIRYEISLAEDYIRLQRCSAKLAKVQASVSMHPDKKSRRQLRGMVEACQGLIKEKTKYFKKKLISQLSHQSIKDESFSKEKTLKYSKSVENFQMEPTNAQPPGRQLTKNDEEELWGNRTEVRGREPQRLQQLVEQLREEMTVYKNKVAILERPISNLSCRLNQQHFVFEHDISLKLKQRGHEIEELKGRLKYYQQTNQELRNRLANQQKRQDDYLGTLKNHITKLENEIELLQRQNRRLQQELAKELTNNTDLQLELQRLFEQTQFLHKEKRQRQQSQVLRLKDSAMRKELIALSQQEKYIRQMESMLQHEKEQQTVLRQQILSLEKREKEYIQQILVLQKEKQKLTEAAEIDDEEIKALKKQLALSMEMVRQSEQELLEAKRQLVRMSQEAEKQQMRKEGELRRKAEHLRHIKNLIEGK